MAKMMPCVGKETYTDMAEDDDDNAPGQASADKQGGSPAATVQDRQISSLRKSVTILAVRRCFTPGDGRLTAPSVVPGDRI